MKTYKVNGTYVLEADEGKILTNGEIQTNFVMSSKTVKLTDWSEIDNPAAEQLVVLSDDEIYNELIEEIKASITIVRGNRKDTSTGVHYDYSPETHTITETFT